MKANFMKINLNVNDIENNFIHVYLYVFVKLLAMSFPL
jgi:hypothetical protein